MRLGVVLAIVQEIPVMEGWYDRWGGLIWIFLSIVTFALVIWMVIYH